jgi:DNA-binding response OmpR family regulator
LEDLGLLTYDPNNGIYSHFSPIFKEFLYHLDFGLMEESQRKQLAQRPAPKYKSMSKLEKKLYDFLSTKPENLCTFREIAENVMGVSAVEWDDEETQRKTMHKITVYIGRLRNKLEETETIVNERGEGYIFYPD